MKAIIDEYTTDIFLNDKEIKEFCKIGQGADTCIWLLCGSKGFECCCLNKPYDLLERWRKGETVARRDGCDKVKNFNSGNQDKREVEF